VAGIAQYTVTWVVQQLNALPAALEQVKAGISMNNARIMEIDRNADQIPDPAKRAIAKAQIRKFVARQAELMRAYKATGQKFNDAYAKMKAWLRERGLLNDSGMHGLGGGPLLAPFLIGAAVAFVVIWAVNARKDNAKQSAVLPLVAQAVGQYTSGNSTTEQFNTVMDRLMEMSKPNPPQDPFGLANLAKELTPLALVVLGFLVLPPIVKSFTSRGAAASGGSARRARLQGADA
jgi:hypothetical protein